MQPVVAIGIILSSSIAAACKPSWLQLNDDRATDAAIAKATTVCRVERKLAALERAD